MPQEKHLVTPSDSPALQYRSEHYPASWNQKVPRRVRMAKTVTSELPPIVLVSQGLSRLAAIGGREYDVWCNSHGAVTAILEGGELLGLRPYEFEIIAWHGEAKSDER
jgi:hypothetical protein